MWRGLSLTHAESRRPAAYAAVAVVRGAIDGFYPYFFFDPAQAGGYGGVALLCVVMLAMFLVLAYGVRAVGNWLSTRRWDDEREPQGRGLRSSDG